MKSVSRPGSAPRQYTRVLVIDGSPIFRQLLATALEDEQDLGCVGTAEDIASGVVEAVRLRPDVVLVVALHLDVGDWSSGLAILAAASPSSRVVVVASAVTERSLDPGQGNGRSVVLAEQADVATLLDAVRAEGGEGDLARAEPPRVDSTEPSDLALAPLAPPDLTLLRLVAAGYDGESAARELRISPGVARHQLRRICSDLGAETPTHAVAIAVGRGMLRLHPDG